MIYSLLFHAFIILICTILWIDKLINPKTAWINLIFCNIKLQKEWIDFITIILAFVSIIGRSVFIIRLIFYFLCR